MTKEKVLIVGGGFGGVKVALSLAGDQRFDVHLLTDRSDLRYYPTLYHAATGAKRRNSSVPLTEIFKDKAVEIHIGKAKTLDRKAKTITVESGDVYDYHTLVLGLGVVTNYFGIPGLQEYAYGIKSTDDAFALKKHLHQQLIDEHKPDLNYLIVGAGPTGIEIATALPGYMETVMAKHGIKNKSIRVSLVEAGPRLLPRLPKPTSSAVKRRLKKLGIKTLLNSVVQGQDADSLTISGKPIQSHTVIWTAGVTNNPFFKENNFVLMPRGKVATDVYLQADDNIFVIGDNANTPYSGLALTAVRDGHFLATNLKRRASGKTFKSYLAKMPVSVIPAGEHWAAVNYGKLSINGFLGWPLREMADLVAFHDYEKWPKAAQQWMTGFGEEEDCPACTHATG